MLDTTVSKIEIDNNELGDDLWNKNYNIRRINEYYKF